jgi:NADH-quinone oxidoreductase subunit H
LFLGGWHAPLRAVDVVPSYVWFFTKLSVLLFVYIWVRGTLPRTRIDQIMNVAWKFMLPMAFACIIAAAVWHYAGRGLRGWLWSLLVITTVYTMLSVVLDTGRKFAPRVYRFAE